MTARKTNEGIFIPKEDFADFGEIELIEKPYIILIKPKSLTDKTKGIIKSLPANLSEVIAEELALWR